METIQKAENINTKYYGVISAMKLINNFLFCGKIFFKCLILGVGNFIEVYNIETNTLIFEKSTCHSNKITLIEGYPSNSKNDYYTIFLICENIIFKLEFAEDDFQKKQQNKLFKLDLNFNNDYIVCFKQISPELILIGYTNNFVDLYKHTNFNSKYFCPKKCIVYSMSIFYDEHDNSILIASGTVFRQIELWKISINENSNKVILIIILYI